MATITQLKTPAELALTRQFEDTIGTLPGSLAVRGLREAAFAAFAATGLPHRRVEEYKYTDLKALIRDIRPVAPPTSADALAAAAAEPRIDADSCFRLFVVDGVYRPEISDIAAIPAGVTVTALRDVLEAGRPEMIDRLSGPGIAHGDPALALNAALMTDGVVIEVAEGVTPERFPHIVHVITASTAVSVHSRSAVIVGRNATLGFIESFATTAAGHQQTSVLNVSVGDGARVEHQVVKSADHSAVNLAGMTVVLGARAQFESFALVTSGEVTRRQYFVRMEGDHARLGLKGASLLGGAMLADTTLVVEHDSLHCESRELFRHVIDADARGVFQGKVIVRPGAQKTDGKMASNCLLLSEGSEMANKPELEIYADDVACGHGATCGEIDETPIFYLMSRGLPRADAEALLIQSFVGEVVDGVGSGPLEPVGEALRDALTAGIEGWLAKRTG